MIDRPLVRPRRVTIRYITTLLCLSSTLHANMHLFIQYIFEPTKTEEPRITCVKSRFKEHGEKHPLVLGGRVKRLVMYEQENKEEIINDGQTVTITDIQILEFVCAQHRLNEGQVPFKIGVHSFNGPAVLFKRFYCKDNFNDFGPCDVKQEDCDILTKRMRDFHLGHNTTQ